LSTSVGTLAGLRHFPHFSLYLGKRGSDEFTIAHLFLTSKKLGRVQNRSRDAHLAGMGLREPHYTRRLRPSEEKAKLYPKWKILQGMTLMLHKRESKSKGEKLCRTRQTADKSKRKTQRVAPSSFIDGACVN
jgi:hypothetical protein